MQSSFADLNNLMRYIVGHEQVCLEALFNSSLTSVFVNYTPHMVAVASE